MKENNKDSKYRAQHKPESLYPLKSLFAERDLKNQNQRLKKLIYAGAGKF
jgi:hypothetical protein